MLSQPVANSGSFVCAVVVQDEVGLEPGRHRRVDRLKDHCVVRWQQLDEGAVPLAHFGIAVLRPALNE